MKMSQVLFCLERLHGPATWRWSVAEPQRARFNWHLQIDWIWFWSYAWATLSVIIEGPTQLLEHFWTTVGSWMTLRVFVGRGCDLSEASAIAIFVGVCKVCRDYQVMTCPSASRGFQGICRYSKQPIQIYTVAEWRIIKEYPAMFGAPAMISLDSSLRGTSEYMQPVESWLPILTMMISMRQAVLQFRRWSHDFQTKQCANTSKENEKKQVRRSWYVLRVLGLHVY